MLLNIQHYENVLLFTRLKNFLPLYPCIIFHIFNTAVTSQRDTLFSVRVESRFLIPQRQRLHYTFLSATDFHSQKWRFHNIRLAVLQSLWKQSLGLFAMIFCTDTSKYLSCNHRDFPVIELKMASVRGRPLPRTHYKSKLSKSCDLYRSVPFLRFKDAKYFRIPKVFFFY